MSERFEEELALLQAAYPGLEYQEQGGLHWVRIDAWALPEGYDKAVVDLAFHIPAQAGQAPYGFWVRPELHLATGGNPGNYTYPANTAWGSDWGQFSWAPCNWIPSVEIRRGSNMLEFVRSFADRLGEGS